MAETCIVCLGDLAASPAPDRDLLEAPPDTTVNAPKRKLEDDPNIIAHLLPCGHDLHHDCLRPWVERANSCPICRANFNVVELCAYVNGPCLSSYAVQEKRQEAEFDPSVFLDDDLFDEPSWQPCLFCEEDTDEDRLLLCDGCNGAYHTFCVGVARIPSGPWFCNFCAQDGANDPETHPRRGRPRTRGQQRRQGAHIDPSAQEWTRVWQSVWRRTNIDLDFPFEEDETAEQSERNQRRELDAIERRLQVAERTAGAARFRDAANSILQAHTQRSRTTTPTPESQDEIKAWNAYDKVNQLRMSDPVTNSRKRKSATSSPVEQQISEPPRRLKRPRTRLPAAEANEVNSIIRAEASSAPNQRPPNAASPEIRPVRFDANEAAPSFLQSLLKEVETASGSSNQTPQYQEKDPLAVSVPQRSDSVSPPPPSSPASSPPTSALPSPRTRSLSPSGPRSRPASPPPLSSRIEPIWVTRPHSPAPAHPLHNGIPTSQEIQNDSITAKFTLKDRNHTHAVDRPSGHSSISKDSKKEIQTLVTATLKPLYRRKEITSEQYTNINRDISRQLYDRVSQSGGLLDDDDRGKWREIAAKEVGVAVNALNDDQT